MRKPIGVEDVVTSKIINGVSSTDRKISEWLFYTLDTGIIFNIVKFFGCSANESSLEKAVYVIINILPT